MDRHYLRWQMMIHSDGFLSALSGGIINPRSVRVRKIFPVSVF